MLAHAAYATARVLRGFGRRPMTGMGLRLWCWSLMRMVGMGVGCLWRGTVGWLPISGLRLVLIASLLILLLMGGLVRFGSVPVAAAMLLALRVGSSVGAGVRSAALMAV
jgi:hypothetical protein